MENFLKELEQANIEIRKRITGSLTGNYKSNTLGNSYDFYGVRPYYEGDNIKNIDWKLFSRTGKIYTKLFSEQKQISVTVLIDNSESMNFGEPNKLNIGKMCALGISYIALNGANKLSLYSFNDSIHMCVNNFSGKSLFYQVLNKIKDIDATGKTDFKKVLLTTNDSKGIAFIITDLLSNNIKEFLNQSAYKYEKVVLIHVMSKDELNPVHNGKIKFWDSETRESVLLDIGSREIDSYKRKVKEFVLNSKEECKKRGIKYVFASKYNSPVKIIMKAIEVE
ncbi:DUF58 domain-containing protein [Clostridium rectalis]|uniref:DUF58 domain-containing protein n=1 Tax=Clostridium rectalis TaxID=2040295 RepID=UPI000F643FFC|nr:DUF58 domain-containing protein [Clostridium rectalis]